MFKDNLTLKEDILLSAPRMESFHNNGTLSTLMTGRENQERENSMKTSASTFKEISTLSLNLNQTDSLTSSTTETWSLRQETAETPKFGGSIKSH
jgi:hypothetical protein